MLLILGGGYVYSLDSSSCSDNEIKGAWNYVIRYEYPGKRNCDILWSERNSYIGYLYVEYLSRFASKDLIISEWESFKDTYYSAPGMSEPWTPCIERFYSLYEAAGN